jgi:hypothetical protein
MLSYVSKPDSLPPVLLFPPLLSLSEVPLFSTSFSLCQVADDAIPCARPGHWFGPTCAPGPAAASKLRSAVGRCSPGQRSAPAAAGLAGQRPQVHWRHRDVATAARGCCPAYLWGGATRVLVD